MSNQHAIVVFGDTAGKFREGDIVTLIDANIVRAGGGACLPVDPIARIQGLGYTHMKWGRAGARSGMSPAAFANVVALTGTGHRRMWWMAQIEANDGAGGDASKMLSGQISLSAVSPPWGHGVRPNFVSDNAPMQVQSLGPQCPGGGWRITGGGGFLSVLPACTFALFGVLNGGRVSSLAISTTEE